MTTPTGRVSLLPSDAVQSGALSDVDARILSARFGSWDYRGQKPPICALLVQYLPEGYPLEEGTALPDHFTQAYSCGPLDRYTPSDDGTYVIPGGGAKGFNKSSNVYLFFSSLENKGYDMSKLAEGDVSVLDNLEVHLVQVAQPKREGLKDAKEGGTTTLIDRILTPGATGSAPAANKPQGAPKPAAGPKATKPAGNAQGAPATAGKASGKPGPSDPDIIEAAHGYIAQMVATAGGTLNKAQIPGLIFAAAKVETDTDRKNAIIQAAFQPATLQSGPWNFDGTTISLG